MKYAIKVPIGNGDWLYVTEPDIDGNPVVVTYDTFEEAQGVSYSVWSNKGNVVEYNEEPSDKLTKEEIEELRAKKQAIHDELYDVVKMEMFKASSALEGIDYDKISRVEVIGPDGREYVRYFKKDESMYHMIQDEGRTLKIVIEENDELREDDSELKIL